jgi:preprotein translocase subunit SecD
MGGIKQKKFQNLRISSLLPTAFCLGIIGFWGMLKIKAIAQTPPPAIKSLDNSSFICPFIGTELTFEVKPTDVNSQVNPELLAEVKEVLLKRIVALKLTDFAIVTLNQNQILAQLSAAKDLEQIQKTLTTIGKLDFRIQKPGTEAELRIEQQRYQELIAEQEKLKGTNNRIEIARNKVALARNQQAILNLFADPLLTGKQIVSAAIEHQEVRTNWGIEISFDDPGAETFAQITKEIADTGRVLGVFFDDTLISAPIVPAEFAEQGISGGKAVITGRFTEEDANNLVIQLQGGTLPAPIDLISVINVNNNRCETLAPLNRGNTPWLPLHD